MNIIRYLQNHPSHRYKVGEVYKYLMDHFDIHPNVEVEHHPWPQPEIHMRTMRPLSINMSMIRDRAVEWPMVKWANESTIEHIAYCQNFGYQPIDGFNAWTFFRCGYYWKRETLSFYRYPDDRDYFQRFRNDLVA